MPDTKGKGKGKDKGKGKARQEVEPAPFELPDRDSDDVPESLTRRKGIFWNQLLSFAEANPDMTTDIFLTTDFGKHLINHNPLACHITLLIIGVAEMEEDGFYEVVKAARDYYSGFSVALHFTCTY